MSTTYIAIIPPPTPNGNLHLGHIAGPFLAGDVFSRFRRTQGDEVLFATGTDDSQSYVVTAAAKKALPPAELCRRSTEEIRGSLDDLEMSVDGFAPFDDEYRRTCLRFLTELHDRGKFTWKRKEFFVRPNGEAVFEAYVRGRCPMCLAATAGGICETCGHPNNFTEILDPFATLFPDEPLAKRTFRILVFELERYRAELVEYYASRAAHWRPHIRRLMDELFRAPLPDFPITYPGAWGFPAPFDGAGGQVINAWAEGMPASMYCTAVAARKKGLSCSPADMLWRTEHDCKLVYFMGFDNSFFWGMSHLALLMAHDGKYILPEAMIPNEFYELENEKFSTSKGHVIWASEIAAQYAIDAIRFHLCWTNPEHHRTNFSRREMEKLLSERIIPLWSSLVENAATLLSRIPRDRGYLPVSDHGKHCVALVQSRLSDCYDLSSFSLREAANVILMHIERLERVSADLSAGRRHFSVEAVGEIWHELLSLLRLGSPVVTEWECGKAIALTEKGYALGELRELELPELRLKRERKALNSIAVVERAESAVQ